MASASGCSKQLEDLGLSDNSCSMEDSSKVSDFATTTFVSVSDLEIASSSYISAVEEQIQHSKSHWSTLANHPDYMVEDGVDFKASNEQEFLALQRHLHWGGFFANFSGDGISMDFDSVVGELVMGKKIAEGAQGELYEAQIKWNDLEIVEDALRFKEEYVVKVFKEGTLLDQVKCQLPEGLLQNFVEEQRHWERSTWKWNPCFTSKILFGILLKDGRFGFLMYRKQFDLRTLIERNMKLRRGEDRGPFSKDEVDALMYLVALGVNYLHNRGIVHRDLKASNVLVDEVENSWPRWICSVADYECSIGVVGTEFFRAPEILQVCKERKVNEKPDVFSKAADVYSYGMICYEILTGKLPFEDHPLSTSRSLLIDLVINQQLRPEIPEYVEDWIRELLYSCWQYDPTRRPKIRKILNVLSTNSIEVNRFEILFRKVFGEHFGR